MLERFRYRLLHLRRHATVSRELDLPEQRHSPELGGEHERRSFRAITNGACVDPLTFTIVDATGRVTTAELRNVEGEEEPVAPPAPAALAVAPTEITDAGCTGKTFNIVVFGGTPPYNVQPTNGVATPQTVNANGGTTAITGLTNGSGDTIVVFLDSSTPKKSATATITCS
jgi:hypothetical protein